MKKFVLILSAILVSTLFCSCKSEDSSSSNSDAKVTTITNNAQFSGNNPAIANAINETYATALDTSVYPYAQELFISVDEDNKLIDYTIIVQNDTTSDEAVEYSTTLLTMLNDYASSHDDSIAKSSDGYYGGVFDEYSALLTVATEDSVLTESDWLVCQTIDAGTNAPVQAGGYIGDSNS